LSVFVCLEPIRGDLLDEELVVRQVLVQRPHDPVAVRVAERVSPLSSKRYPLVSA
jgi:hypothetical protein